MKLVVSYYPNLASRMISQLYHLLSLGRTYFRNDLSEFVMLQFSAESIFKLFFIGPFSSTFRNHYLNHILFLFSNVDRYPNLNLSHVRMLKAYQAIRNVAKRRKHIQIYFKKRGNYLNFCFILFSKLSIIFSSA